jgi:hypothetical protein
MFNYFDAISKNVFEPYTRQFATLVISLFLKTYETVDRGKMRDMNTTEKELFGVVPQVAIEQGVWGGDSTGELSFYDRICRQTAVKHPVPYRQRSWRAVTETDTAGPSPYTNRNVYGRNRIRLRLTALVMVWL